MSWNPSDSETFVFRNADNPMDRVVLLIPGDVPNPLTVVIDGVRYIPDHEMTDQTRMHVRVSNRKRGLAD